MMEFTFWDILRNLLLATRWTLLLSLIGFATVIFNFTIVNVFFKGLHAYSGL